MKMASSGPVALIDFDMTGFPNLALMKFSAFHKAQEHEVFPLNFLMGAEVVYGSCVFPKNAQRERLPNDAIVGGTGFGSNLWLPPEVEHIMPDYTLYGTNYSMGFTSRGCPRRCPWCLVPAKEGSVRPWARIYEFWDRSHRHIKLLDNNLLAAPNWRQTLEDIVAEGLEVDFNQGLDIRLVNEANAGLLAQVKAKPGLRFSFDSLAMEDQLRKGLRLLTKASIRSSSIGFYALLGFGPPENDLARLRILVELGVWVFPMNYQPIDGSKRVPLAGPGTGFLPDFPLFHGPRTSYQKAMRLIKARMGL